MNIAFRRNKAPAVPSWALAAGVLLLAAGCQMPYAPTQAAQARRTPAYLVEDACAERLGDICTRLLLYYSERRELPPRLEDLSDVGPRTPLGLSCPVSGLAYVYNRNGIAVAHTERRIVVQDPTPCHNGTRWVIAADPAKAGKPRVIQVLRLSATAELSEK
ncbi:MAG: hypothetical protein NTV86_20660 [Planctomycetota bacterium]|nr:hypothetical protein [Planctomycetota bacterium]